MDNKDQVEYTGNGTAGREADVQPTGFFFQMPKQEPVAWQCSECGGTHSLCPHERKDVPLYTAPPQREWQGLTDEEIMDACSAVWASHPIEVGRVVEAKLKEKNT